MRKSIICTAFSKLNLHLRVLEKRSDGYHRLESLFQLISISDKIVIFREGLKHQCIVECSSMKLPKVNTISLAVQEFRKRTGIYDGLYIVIEKNIPAGAGLGGGSSNAATVLVGLNDLFETELTYTELFPLATAIGSDVPFFLFGGAAIVQGRGERIQPITSRTDLYGILVWPEIHSSTKDAYVLVDRWKKQKKEKIAWPSVQTLAHMYSGPLENWNFANSFLEPLSEKHPQINLLIQEFYAHNALFASMTGAGSSVFALFASKKQASKVYAHMIQSWNVCFQFLLLASSQMR